MKIIDCFTFYNEMDLLNYRLNILDDIVDYFVIVESTHTHVGKEKELFFGNNKEFFKKFEEKIIHIIVDDLPLKILNSNKSIDAWINEKFQRNQIARGLKKINLNQEDIIIVTDLDEIPDKNTLEKIKNNEIKININELEMELYYCNLNHKKKSKWRSARIISYKTYSELSLCFDDIRFYKCPIIENGGWHLSYFGDAQFIKNKIENFAHQEFNTENFTNLEKINKRLDNFSDVFDRDQYEAHNPVIKISVKDNNNLPPEYEKYLQKFIVF